MIVWNANPLVIMPNAELMRAGMARDDLFTVVHEQFLTDTARVRRHRAAGDDAARGDRRRHCVGTPVAGVERGGDRAARRGGEQQRAVPPLRRRDGLHRARAVRRRRDGARARRCRRSTSASCARTGFVRIRDYPDRRPAVRRRHVPHRIRARSSCAATSSAALGQPVLPTFVTPTRMPARRPVRAARYPLQPAHAQAATPGSSTPATRTCPATGRGRGRRSSSSIRRRRDRSVASSTVTASRSPTTGPRCASRRASPAACGPVSSRSRSGGGAASTATTEWPTR